MGDWRQLACTDQWVDVVGEVGLVQISKSGEAVLINLADQA